MNSLVIEGITGGINSSMLYLADQISIKYNKMHSFQPLFDVKLDLADRDVVFDPTIKCNDRGNGIRDIIQNIVNDFVSLGVLVPRLDVGIDGGGDYLVEIKDQFIVYGAMNQVENNF